MKRIANQLKEYYHLLFRSAAENQIRLIGRGGPISVFGIKFRSYSHLKKVQRKIRRISFTVFLAFAAWFLGMVVGPVFFPTAVPTEVYIPNGRGDILISNVSKNQITIIFKTFDAAHGNIPLATQAYVEIYGDENYRSFIKKTNIDDYAVTHVINIDKLDEEKMYYLKIFATDATASTNEQGSVMVASWGDGKDPIKAFTNGAVISKCLTPADVAQQIAVATKQQEGADTASGEQTFDTQTQQIAADYASADPNKLEISSIDKEGYLHDNTKVQAIISWVTNKPASTALLYREGTSGEMTEMLISSELKTKHMAVVMTFKPGVMYYFKAKATTEDGITVISDEYSLLTPRPKETMMHTISSNFKALVRQILPK